jgi:hypothetical protein|tara:strand:+ start:1762 stop:2625 length:864 start_codon:yes stop_codon:yes gene_type:complete
MKLCQHDECAKVSETIYEKKDACYTKVKSRYDVWPSAYASGALVKCRKVGAKNWGNKSKKEVAEGTTQKFKSAVIDKAIKIAKSMGGNMTSAVKKIEKLEKNLSKNGRVEYALQQANEGSCGYGIGGELGEEPAGPHLLKKKEKTEKGIDEACWVGYKQVGMKDKGGKQVPNCVKEIYEIYYESEGKGYGYTFENLRDNDLNEAEYQGRKVKLGKPMQGDTKKFKVYVKNPKGNVVKVNFGQGGDAKGGTMRIRKSNPAARKSFRARMNCDSPGPRHKARYWSCRKW